MVGENNVSGSMKDVIAARLDDNDFESICEMALRHRSVLGILNRFAFDKTTLVGWRAILAIGCVARKLIVGEYEFIRITIRKLLWSLSDESGGIGWSSPEILGEIVSADPGKMSDVIPLIAEVYGIEEATFRPGVLYALKRIAEVKPEAILPYKNLAQKGLFEPDPLARIYAMDLIAELMKIEELSQDICEALRSVKNDRSVGWIYKDGGFVSVEVREYVSKFTEYCAK